MQRCRYGAAVGYRDVDEDIVGGCLGILDAHIEVGIGIEDARVKQVKLGGLTSTSTVFFD